jgi:alanine racemase
VIPTRNGVAADPVETLATWLEIDGRAYVHNLRTFRRIVGPDVLVMAVLKANAYGHGASVLAPLAVGEGVDYIGLHSLDEFLEIRDLVEDVPVCLLGPTLPSQASAVVAAGAEPTVSMLETVAALAQAARAAGRTVAIHIKAETGTHRQGVALEEIPAWCDFLREHGEVRFRGMHTHFANIEDTTDHTFARRQMAQLAEARRAFAEHGQVPELTHSACSAATIVMPQTHRDLVRLGISSYGLWPSRETLLSTLLSRVTDPDLVPVLRWYARIAQIKETAAGEYVGYGCTFRTTHAMRMAVLPVGYFDGYDRRLSAQSYVLVRGRRAPVVGRICMNMTMIDITDMPEVELGEQVTLIGQCGGETIAVDALARLCGTIHYEFAARLGRHLPRLLASGAPDAAEAKQP